MIFGTPFDLIVYGLGIGWTTTAILHFTTFYTSRGKWAESAFNSIR